MTAGSVAVCEFCRPLNVSKMTEFIVGIFIAVYLGMILGGLPLLQLDRTGVALLGAIALIGFNAVSLEEAARRRRSRYTFRP